MNIQIFVDIISIINRRSELSNIFKCFRLQGWRENKQLDSIEEHLSQKIKHEYHCRKCKHLGLLASFVFVFIFLLK